MRPLHHLLLALLGAALFHDPANAAILRVGTGTGCTHQDLGSAVLAARDGDGIFVNAGTYPVANLHFDAKTLTFRGGYASCTATTPSTDASATRIDAMNVGSAAIIVGTTDLILDTLTLYNGHADSGGGIRFVGRGRLALLNVVITSNLATRGGGVDIEANGPTVVSVGAGTLISENHALGDGGGVRLAGDVHLLFIGPQAAIANNSADDDQDGVGDGGGLLIEGPAYADIASPGYDAPGGASWGAIYGNTAANGAGVEVRAGGTLRLIETVHSQGRPTRVEFNGDERTQTGGGIEAYASGARVCGWGFRISGNRARQIAGISAGNANTVEITRDVISSPCGSAPVSASGAVDCGAGAACNAIVGNESLSGSPIVLAGVVLADSLEFRDNATLNFGINASAVTIGNCLFANNAGNAMIFANSTSIDECTFAGNETASVVSTTGNAPSVALSRSILWQPGIESIYVPASTQGANVTVFDTIAADAQTFAGSGFLLSGRVDSADPRFTAPTEGDYHLALASPAIDYTLTGSALDLDGRPRGIDIRNDPGGRRNDIGAYEYADSLFVDGFDPD
jgi:hypothetical protein